MKGGVCVNKRLRTIVVVLGLTVVVGGGITLIQNQTFANDTKTQVKATGDSNANEAKIQAKATDDSDWLTPERKKELNDAAQSKQAERILTKYGTFYPVKIQNEYPSDQVANLDNDGEEITAKTKQVILRNFTYEKKKEEN